METNCVGVLCTVLRRRNPPLCSYMKSDISIARSDSVWISFRSLYMRLNHRKVLPICVVFSARDWHGSGGGLYYAYVSIYYFAGPYDLSNPYQDLLIVMAGVLP